MAFSQVAFSLKDGRMLETAALQSEEELEAVLEQHIDMLDANWMVIGRHVEIRNGKRLDLLCMDRAGKLIVVELKKGKTPREVTAQAIEYASYMQELQADDVARLYAAYRKRKQLPEGSLDDAFKMKFDEELTDLDEALSSQRVQMVIVAAQMDEGTEHIIRYLRSEYDVDINILFFKVFAHGEDRILNRVWLEEEPTKVVERTGGTWNGEYYVSFGGESRVWDDAQKYGFISAGGRWHTKTLEKLHAGCRIWVNLPHIGYVGAGIVQGEMVRASEAVFCVDGQEKAMTELPLKGSYFDAEEDEQAEYIVPVEWIKTVSQNRAVKESGFFGNQNTVCCSTTMQWAFTVDRLKKLWNIQD